MTSIVDLNIDDPVAYKRLQQISMHLNQIVAIGMRKEGRTAADDAALAFNREAFFNLLEGEVCEDEEDDGTFV